MLRLLHVYRVDLATLDRAIGSGDERLVREILQRHAPDVRRRGSDLREGADSRQPDLVTAIGELIDGALRVPELPEPYGVALELLCRTLGARIDSGPYAEFDDADSTPLVRKLCAGGPPLERLAPLARLGNIGHLTTGDVATDATLVRLFESVHAGEVLVGFSGFH